MRLTWIGHSTVLVDTGAVRLLTDPALRGRITHLRRVAPLPPDGVGSIDAALVSHLHYDHLDLPSLRRLGRSTRIVVPAGAGAFMSRKKFANVCELAVGEQTAIGDALVTATEARHPGGRPPRRISAPALGYLVEAASARVYFAGDTELFPGMQELAPGLDVALLPVWGWGPSIGAGHLDPRGAAEALTLLRPRIAIPIHWGTYFPLRYLRADARSSFLRDPVESFRRHAAELAPGVDVRLLGLGDTLDVD